MIKCRENRNDIIQRVEIDLTEIPAQGRRDLESKITKYLNYKDKSIFRFDAGNKLIYESEVLTPKVNKSRLNVLMVLGNPAVHSVAERMFFSYEKTRTQGKWKEHRFWRALRDCRILRFKSDLENPTCENIEKINACKRDWLLNGEYESKFNIFLLPYFSFPTPPSGECNGVTGIRKKTNALKEIKQRTKCEQVKSILNDPRYPVYKLDDALKYVTLYYAGSTKSILTDEGKKILRGVVSDIKAKNKIG